MTENLTLETAAANLALLSRQEINEAIEKANDMAFYAQVNRPNFTDEDSGEWVELGTLSDTFVNRVCDLTRPGLTTADIEEARSALTRILPLAFLAQAFSDACQGARAAETVDGDECRGEERQTLTFYLAQANALAAKVKALLEQIDVERLACDAAYAGTYARSDSRLIYDIRKAANACKCAGAAAKALDEAALACAEAARQSV